jgi:hypothetical protein
MTLTRDSVLWNSLPQSGNIASPTFSEKIRNPTKPVIVQGYSREGYF